MNAYQITPRIEIASRIYKNEYEWMHGILKNEQVEFCFINTKTGKEITKTQPNYREAMSLALERSKDGRYRNYNFFIHAK